MTRKSYTLQSASPDISSIHTAPHTVITMILTIFPVRYFTSPRLFCNCQSVLLNPFRSVFLNLSSSLQFLRVVSRGGVPPLLPPPQTGLSSSCQGPYDSTEHGWSGGPLTHPSSYTRRASLPWCSVLGRGAGEARPSNIQLLLK